MIAALLATIVLAQGGGGAEELWERYPLDPTATPSAQREARAPSGERDEPQVEVVQRDDDGFGTAGLVALIAVAATGGAAALRFAQLAARKRRVTAEEDAPPAIAPPAPAPTSLLAEPPASAAAPPPAPPAPPARPAPPAAPAKRQRRPAPPPRAMPPPVRQRPPAPRPPEPEPAPAPEPTRRFAPTGERWELCRIRLWRGYVSRCYVAEVEGAEAPIARSPSFKAVSTPEATAALQAMVGELRDKGWEQIQDADGAWHGWMRRPAAARAPR
jgi:hypothetical protein